jgi:hypothetical protein
MGLERFQIAGFVLTTAIHNYLDFQTPGMLTL